jgi:hypothetical protein
MIPPLPGAPTAEVAGVAVAADQVLALADPSARKEMKQLLGLLQSALWGFVFHGVSRPFTELSAPEQDRVLERWEHSALAVKRTGFQALHTWLLSCYYAQPATWAALGYPGPPRP